MKFRRPAERSALKFLGLERSALKFLGLECSALKFAVLILSLSLGFAGTCLYAGRAGTDTPADRARLPRTEQAAWWGGLYPGYCLPEAMEAAEAEPGEKEPQEGQVKIRFKYLTFLNEI